MKIILLNPLSSSRETEFCDIGLGYLAAGLRDHGHHVRLLLKLMREDSLGKILREERPDLVGIKVLSANLGETRHTVEVIRSSCGSTIVVGGPHVTGDPLGAVSTTGADYGIAGEADLSFPRLAGLLAEGGVRAADEFDRVPGLIHQQQGVWRANPQEVVTDLDSLPMTAWDLMPPADYPSLVSRRSPAASVLTSRGCTNACHFCAESFKRLRHRSPGKVVAEIEYLVSRFGVREIQFLDSNFIARRDYIQELCALIRDRGLDLAYCAPNGTRLEAIDEEVCRLLASIGFYRVNVGVESGSQEVLDRVHKQSSLSLTAEKVALFRKYGIQVVGNFMLGFPGETRSQLEATLSMALSLDLNAANFSIYVPMPGTKLYERLVSEGKTSQSTDFSSRDYVNYENDLSDLSSSELRRFRNRCLARFYFRWRTIRLIVELVRGGISWESLVNRLYWMYGSKLLRRRGRDS